MQKRELATTSMYRTAAGWQTYGGLKIACVTSAMETKTCSTKNTGNAWPLLTMCSSDYGSQCSLVYTADNTPSYWGFHSSGMWRCVTGCGSSNIWKDPLTCQDHSPSRTASYPWGPESSVACCENLKFCRTVLVWQNTECNIYACNILNTEYLHSFNV